MTGQSAGGSPPSSEDIQQLLDWVSSRTGLSFRGQHENAFQVFRRRMLQAGEHDPATFRRNLELDHVAFDDLVGELTVGETYFFRDEKQFAIIRGEFLTTMRGLRPDNHLIRVWSAGCATGEEAWSLAVILAEAGLQKTSQVLGTDISRPALKRAKSGHYRHWSMRGEAASRMLPWMETDTHFDIRPSLRGNVLFDYLNLAEDTYPSFVSHTVGLDLILCRNVLIYFDRDTISKVASRFYKSLSPGGWLMTGASDPPLAKFAPFEVLSTSSGIVYVRPAVADGKTVTESTPQKSALQKSGPPPSVVSPTGPTSAERLRLRNRAAALAKKQLTPENSIEQAERSLERGDYNAVLALTTDRIDDSRACVLRVRALANLDTAQAEAFCAEAVQRHPTDKELRYLGAILLTELNRLPEAVAAARKVIFLDRMLAVGHMALGTVLQRTNDLDGARRAFRNARQICQARPGNEIVPLSDGEHAGRLAESAEHHLSLLSGPTRPSNGIP